MNKQDLLNQILYGLNSHLINREDIIGILDTGNEQLTHPQYRSKKNLDFGKIISLVGGLIVFIGISSLISIYWRDFGTNTKILITLGIGLVTFAIGSVLMMQNKFRFTGLALHIISPFLITGGAWILIYEVIIGSNPPLNTIFFANSIASFIIFGMYLTADFLLGSKLFSFIAWIFGGLFYWSLIAYLLNTLGISDRLLFQDKFLAIFGWLYCFIMALSLYLTNLNPNKKIYNTIVEFCIMSYFLANTFWFLQNNSITEILFGFIIFVSIYLSSYVNKVSTLFATIIGLVLFLSYITTRYFAGVVGWPVSIIIIGLCFVGSGYLFINLKSKLHK